jgi:hypothetical protein
MNMPLAPTTPSATGNGPSAPSATTPTGAGGGTAGGGGEGQGGEGAAGQSAGGAGNATSGDTGSDGESSGETGEDSGEAGSAETSLSESDENGADAGLPEGLCAVQPMTDEFRQNYDNLDPFYQKYADAGGLPVISSLAPSDEALERVCLLVLDMISARPDVHEELLDDYIRLRDAFENAQSTGLFEDTYAMENYQEYWAEGVQDWYYTNLESDPPNGVHNSIDRREELLAYDPALYELIAEFLPDEPQFVDCYSDE